MTAVRFSVAISANYPTSICQRHAMQIKWLRTALEKWPGEKRLGVYRFLPLFFILGAALEFSMINWRVNEVNFYNTYKKRQAKDLIEKALHNPH